MSAYFWYLKRDISKTVQVRKLKKDFLWNFVAGFVSMVHVARTSETVWVYNILYSVEVL